MGTPRLGARGGGWVAGQFVLLAAIAAAGMVQFAQPGDREPAQPAAAVIGGVMILLGSAIAVRGVLDLGSSMTPFPRPSAASQVVEIGVYRHVRHPIYIGIVVASIGWGVATLAPLAVAIALVLLAWFDVKARAEEAWLAERHPGYAAYRARTRKFVPFVY